MKEGKYPGLIIQFFFYGVIIIALGFLAKNQLERMEGFAFLKGALTLGGALIICGLFSFKNHWHGILGGGVVALLGFCRSALQLPELAESLSSIGGKSPAVPLIEGAVCAMCAIIVINTIRVLYKEKTRKMLE